MPMKKILILFMLVVAACSTPQEKQANAILAMSKTQTLGMLQGKTPEQVRNVLGEPTFVRKEKPNESWVFKAPDCAVFVFFDGNGIASYTQSKGTCDKQITHQLLKQRAAGS